MLGYVQLHDWLLHVRLTGLTAQVLPPKSSAEENNVEEWEESSMTKGIQVRRKTRVERVGKKSASGVITTTAVTTTKFFWVQ